MRTRWERRFAQAILRCIISFVTVNSQLLCVHGHGARSLQWNAIRRAVGRSLIHRGGDRVPRVCRQRAVHPTDTAIIYRRQPAVHTASSAVQFPIQPAFAVRPDADHVWRPARWAGLYSRTAVSGGIAMRKSAEHSLLVNNFQTVKYGYKEIL